MLDAILLVGTFLLFGWFVKKLIEAALEDRAQNRQERLEKARKNESRQ